MTCMDIKVYERFRKSARMPDYEANTAKPHQLVADVPIFLVVPEQLDAAVNLENVELIQQHCWKPLIVLTDRRRVLAIDPQGYGYARYVCTIDAETAGIIISRV